MKLALVGELTTWSRCDEVKGNLSSSFYYYMRYLVRNHLQVSSLKSIFVNAKILILSYKISILAFTKIVLEQRYLEMSAPLDRSGAFHMFFYVDYKVRNSL